MGSIIPRPSYDPEVYELDHSLSLPIPDSDDGLGQVRKNELASADELARRHAIHSDPTISTETRKISGPRGEIELLILHPQTPPSNQKSRPGVVFFHGGGLIMGTIYFGLNIVSDLVKDPGATIISVNYGLAPEKQGSALVEDCYAALLWVSEHLRELGIDPHRLMVAGISAGGGLAAGTAILARDRQGPKLCAQLLVCPMLDDRCSTVSSLQFEEARGYYTGFGRYAWKCVLGEQAGKEGVDPHVAPGRATDLSNLPPAYIDAGSAEPFRDEDVAYAMRLWECGSQADLHIWGGGNHGFGVFGPPTRIGDEAKQSRDAWLRRILQNGDV